MLIMIYVISKLLVIWEQFKIRFSFAQLIIHIDTEKRSPEKSISRADKFFLHFPFTLEL